MKVTFMKLFNVVSWPTLSYFRLNLPACEMAVSDMLQRLELRAVEAEKLIDSLKQEVADIKKTSSSLGRTKLNAENERLRKEVEEWKNKLIKLEMANGKIQIPLPSQNGVTREVCCDSVSQKMKLTDDVGVKVQQSVEDVQVDSKSQEKKKEKKKKQQSSDENKTAQPASEEPPVDVGRLDLRVGRIVVATRHPDADSLYVEQVDVGEEKPRTVVSGLVKHVPLEEMQNRLVVLLCNLKPAKMRGVTSEAMVMCASSPEKVEILIPPEGSEPGDLVHVEGYPRVPDPILNPKKKIFETVAPDLLTDQNKIATYKGAPFTVPGKGMVVAPTLKGVNVK